MSNFYQKFSRGASAKKQLPKYTKEEVALHSTDKDLWVYISDKVYNFSGYAKSHPGGA